MSISETLKVRRDAVDALFAADGFGRYLLEPIPDIETGETARYHDTCIVCGQTDTDCADFDGIGIADNGIEHSYRTVTLCSSCELAVAARTA